MTRTNSGFQALRGASKLVRSDHRSAESVLRELTWSNHSLTIGVATPPEEFTTLRVAQQLALTWPQTARSVPVLLHSKGVEGGRSRLRRPPSGADLQISMEVRKNRWLNLLLQAKKHGSYGRRNGYGDWRSTQIQDLRNWARSHNQVPGMLLYNGGPPFISNSRVLFDSCCRGWAHCCDTSPRDSVEYTRIGCTPLGITLMLLPKRRPRSLMAADVKARDVNKLAVPWECLYCNPRATRIQETLGSGDLPFEWVEAFSGQEAEVPTWMADHLLDDEPVWARQLREVASSMSREDGVIDDAIDDDFAPGLAALLAGAPPISLILNHQDPPSQ